MTAMEEGNQQVIQEHIWPNKLSDRLKILFKSLSTLTLVRSLVPTWCSTETSRSVASVVQSVELTRNLSGSPARFRLPPKLDEVGSLLTSVERFRV